MAPGRRTATPTRRAAAEKPAVAAPPPTAGVSTLAPARTVSASTRRAFLAWTAVWWGLVGVWGLLFYVDRLDFVTSAQRSLYGICVWLNGFLLALWTARGRPRLERFHELVSLWLVSYGVTNAAWELPFVLLSRTVFVDLRTLDDVVALTPWMRERPANMWFWVLASFSSCDLRTVNHDGTFFALELFCVINLAATALFFKLNAARHRDRYLVPMLFLGGAPCAATCIFSFAEVFNGYANMPGGVADTLLALVWTQYQYVVFPVLVAGLCVPLLRADWAETAEQSPSSG